jgi:mannonate dehydratase
LIQEQLIEYVRSAVTHTGGLTHMKKLMAFAELFGVKSGFHGPTDVSPAGMAANLHFDLAIPNCGIQEYMKPRDETLEVFHTSYTFEDGCLHLGNKPGLGVDSDEKLAAKYPYQARPLPVDRLLDGIMHEW